METVRTKESGVRSRESGIRIQELERVLAEAEYVISRLAYTDAMRFKVARLKIEFHNGGEVGDGAYPIRISGQLLVDLDAAAEKFGTSTSSIFTMAMRQGRKSYAANFGFPVVFGENNYNDHKENEVGYVDKPDSRKLKIYQFDPQPENNPELFRQYLREYLDNHDLTPMEPGAGEQYVRQCVQTAAALMRNMHKPPTKAMINKYRPKKKKTVKSI